MVQETGIKAIPMEKKRQKATWLSGKAFHIAVRRREAKSKGEKKRYNHLNAESQRLARRETKAFFSDPCPDREDNNRTGKTRESLPERQRYQRNVSCQDGPDQGQTWYGPNRSRRCGDLVYPTERFTPAIPQFGQRILISENDPNASRNPNSST